MILEKKYRAVIEMEMIVRLPGSRQGDSYDRRRKIENTFFDQLFSAKYFQFQLV